MSSPRSLVVLGAGLCAAPAVERLSRDGDFTVHVVSSLDGEAHRLCEDVVRRPNCIPHTIDVSRASVSDPERDPLLNMLRDADAAFSLLPASMHAPIAADCIRVGTPLATASYVAPELAALHGDAIAAGVPLLCEMGLDPGLDHMSAAALIGRVHASGGAVTTFSSVCGGLPAPEAAFGGNPLGYKFSWSPAGVIAATRNSARWLEGGVEVTTDAAALLKSAMPLTTGQLGRTLSLEVLPNRDALPYTSLYGVDGEARGFFRGTLRYAGWSETFDGFASMGLTDPHALMPATVRSWPQLLSHLGVADGNAVPHNQKSLDALRWLGAFDHGMHVDGTTVAEAFCSLLASRLSYAAGERDMIVMEHTIRVEYPDARPPERISSALVGFGDQPSGGHSAMASSVGLTAAAGVLRLLQPPSDNWPALHGVLRPTEPSVWQYCLPLLEADGFRFQEGVEPAGR